MEPITGIIYIAISLYSWAFISNIYDYTKLQSNHRDIKEELHKNKEIYFINKLKDI